MLVPDHKQTRRDPIFTVDLPRREEEPNQARRNPLKERGKKNKEGNVKITNSLSGLAISRIN